MKFYVCLVVVLWWPASAEPQLRPASYRIETVAGSSRDGDGGAATLAQISKIQALAVDRSGNLYLSDTDHHRVRKVSPSGLITTVAGTGVPGYSGDGAPAAQAQLNLPYGLAADSAGNLYIADLGNNRIRRVWPDGVITTLIPDTPLATPRNLALDAGGNLYVSEFDGHRVRRISPDGRVTTVAGTGHPGFSGDGGAPEFAQLAYPAGIAIDRGGALLIADAGNNRVRRIFSNGTINTILGGSSGTLLATPVALAADLQGNLYIADSAPVVRMYSLSGRWSDFAGGGVPGYSGDGGPGFTATLSSVRDLAVDAASNVYIADANRVRRVDVLGIISTVAGDGYLHAIGDGGPAPDAILAQPSALALDASGNLLIADTGTQRIRQVSSGAIATLAGDGTASAAGLSSPMGVAVDAAGTVWIADTGNSRIRSLGRDRVARTVTSGVRLPRGVCLSRTGVPYIVDTGNGRILRLGTSTEIAASQLNAPEACALDSFGNLYVAETGAHRVRRLSPAGQWTTVVDSLTFPRGVAADDGGNVFVSDTGGNRILQVTPDGAVQPIAGTGVAGFSGDGGDALAARLNAPAGLFLDGAGALYVADAGNSRIRRLAPGDAVDPLTAAVAVVNALSGTGGSVAPGELVRVSGNGFGDSPAEVWFGSRRMPVLESSPGNLTVQVPDDLAGGASTHLEVRVAGAAVGAADLGIAAAAPGVLPLTLNADGSLNNLLRPAASGSLLLLFVTGQGRLESARPVLPLSVTVSAAPAEVVSAQAAAAGIVSVAVRIPGGFVPGGQVPLVLTVGGAAAPPIRISLR